MANGDDEIRRMVDETLAGLGPADIQTLARRSASAGVTPIEQPLSATKPPSRRRPRRTDPVTLRVRADLAGTKPAVWRRLELASDLFLDDVHEIMQAAFGWTDSHLHRFGCGPTYYSRETEYYLCPFSVDEGDEGVPEDQVRLDGPSRRHRQRVRPRLGPVIDRQRRSRSGRGQGLRGARSAVWRLVGELFDLDRADVISPSWGVPLWTPRP